MANQGRHAGHPVKFSAGSNISQAANISGETIVGFDIPVGFEGATCTLLAARTPDGVFRPVKDSTTGNAVTIYTAADTIQVVNPALLAGLQCFKLHSASAVVLDRTIHVITRPTN